MATFFVTNLNDTGAGSLRAAIAGVNAEAPGSENAISFSVAGTITLASGLPAISNMVAIIAGDSTTGSAPTVGIDFNGNAGLVFAAGADGSQLMGLALGNATGNGVTLEAGDILLNNNYIGLALDGTAAGNTGAGVFVAASSSGNRIGFNPEAATLAADGQPASGVVSNVISANGGNGITLQGSDDNTIVSNRIGTSTDGNTALANGGNGIHLTGGADGNTIGGTVTGNDASGNPNNPTGNKGDASAIVVVAPPLGNLVSGNAGDGIRIDSNSTGNTLSGNYVGTATGGTSALGNQGDGVAIIDADSNTLVGCLVTDNPFVYYNVVAGNAGNGIRVTDSDNVTIRANFVGLGADNATVVANAADGILINGNSANTRVGGVIPLGNVVAGNGNNGIEVADTASGFSTLNTFGGITAFFGIAPNGNNGILITSTGGDQIIQTNVISGNLNNGIEISGDASGVTIVPNIIGLDTRGDGVLANGGSGILITGTAHDIVVGGTGIVSSDSVIRQNTISGNGNYGIEIAGAAYNNTIADSAIGTDIQELEALPNGAGGVQLSSTGIGNVVGTAIVGFSPLPAPAAHVNVISGNDGAGVTIDSGVNFNAVLNNWIGLNVLGQAILPNTGPNIVDNGGTNLVYGNAASGPLPVESPTGQLEALYIGWFGRAADAPGFESNMATFLGEIQDGASIADAALVVSQRFATAPESAPYAALAALVPPIAAPTPAQTALADSFIDQTFNNLFARDASFSELLLWRTAFFDDAVSFPDLVYSIASAAQGGDIAVMNAKIQAASYFTEAASKLDAVMPPAAMVAAVASVTDITTALASVAATDTLAGSAHTQVDYQSILSPLDIITGVRADLHGSVILTGSQGTLGSVDTTPFLFQGPLNNTAFGTTYLLNPVFAGQDITTGTFYGPDTAIFTPSIGLGNVRAVGSYQYQQSPAGVINHGMIYQGPIDGTGGTWTQVDVPSNGVNVTDGIVIGTTVADTILHSTMGDLVVGNYDLDPSGEAGANGFLYNIATGQYTLMSINGSTDNLTSLYGIWQNGVESTSYTLAGGTKDTNGLNVAFLENYDSLTGVFSNLTFFTGGNRPGVVTHFENITAVPGGFNLVATTDSGPSFASVTVNPDGSFGEAVWADIDLPASDLQTGNIVYQNVVGGIYTTDGNNTVGSYLGVVDQSHVSASGGLIMPVGAHDFAYSLSVGGSTGAVVVGSTAAGNVLGGSIGNDTITGNQTTTQPDTIFTGGGADTIILSAGGTVQDRVELFAANGSDDAMALSPGAPVQSVAGSIVDANNIPQLGWWGQATAQPGGPASNVATNAGFGTGTSLDMSTVANFTTGSASAPVDTVDIALNAFSGLLRGLGADTSPDTGSAVFSNLVAPGGTVTVADANVLLIDSPLGFANAASVAAALAANPITFAAAQTAAFNHYIVAYQDLGGDVRIADMNIASSGAPFTTTAGGATLAISDMAELQGVSLAALQPANITFLTGTEIASSTYLDFTGYRVTDETTVEAAYGLQPGDVREFNGATDGGINVAIILERANDPTALLDSNWATRQQTLSDLGTDGVFDLYGADETLFNNVVAELQSAPYGLTVLDDTNSANEGYYVTSAESRTIWVAIESQQDFQNLFQTPLEYSTVPGEEFVFWNGLLSLPTEWNVAGLWFDTDNAPEPSDLGGTPGFLTPGAQSAGNSTTSPNVLAPQDIAALYNFPLVGQTATTGLIGLIEPGYGSSLSDDPTGAAFQQRLVDYLDRIGQVGAGDYYVQGIDGQSGVSLERSLDVGVVAAINPNSLIGLYNGSGSTTATGNATASVFTAVQSAIWDTTNNPAVTSNSWSDSQSLAPYSPFYAAYHELFTDAALRNQSTFIALGDGGSGNQTGNGLTNVTYSSTSPYNVLVGGTSLSTTAVAANDYTLNATVASAMAGDRETIWQLVIGGLRTLPTTAAAAESFVESVWNYYYAAGSLITGTQYDNNGYLQNSTGSGGVDPTQPVPWYQQAYGLDPTTADLAPWRQSGRGVPDVAANAGGNLLYDVQGPDMLDPSDDYGTSAAAPLWASLGVQLNTIFADHGLPQQLGYMNDLLYIASAIAPASFNDVTIGNNISSFLFATPGSYTTNDNNGTPFGVDPTNVGYYAGPGYDLTTGLGTPNGLLLARALTTIAHAQVSYGDSPDMLDSNGSGGWTSGVGQTLLFQTMSGNGASISLDLGTSVIGYQSAASGLYAWTSQLAQQSLQRDFDPALVRMFDKYGQGAVAQSFVASGESVAVQINGASADAIQGTLSSAFGFADFLTSTGALRVARPVAVAETAGGLDDQSAVVRVRQNGQDSNTLTFYRVDDYAGTINGLQPGQAGYIEAAQATTYQFASGGTVLAGPGYGEYTEGRLVDVDSGDLIAMAMVNHTRGNLYWGFSQANGDGMGHLWNYGLNTWGWEDLYGGGDHDYNDMIVQLDFTSMAGQGLLA